MDQYVSAGLGQQAIARGSAFDTNAAVSKSPQPFTAELSERIGRLAEIVGHTGSNLRDVRSRLLGSWPEPGENLANTKQSPNGIGADLLERLDVLIAAAEEVAAHASILNNRI